MGYSYSGDILTDEDLSDYWFNANVGVYGGFEFGQGFDDRLTVYQFLIDFLETFNGYIEVSDSSRSIGLYFWKNIETVKERFVDYSDLFVNFKEYVCEGGLAKVNTMAYADSPDFYNGFFDNNKSIEDSKEYLSSSFGAGTLRLFDDQELEENGTLEPRANGETTEPQTINIFRFEDVQKSTAVYYNGVLSYQNLYRAFSPNILEIWQKFHKKYCDNIALPTTGLFTFRYNAIFLSEFKMFEVFFINQLSTYWLPLELNFTSKKEAVRVKCLMIEKTAVDVPEVFDFNISIDFYGEGIINDVNLLYSALNVSPAATLIITAADLAQNNIFVNGTQVLAFPTPVDVSDDFEIVVQSIEADNIKSNSNILFQFVSEDGGISRVATLNVAHNGRANYVSEFRSNPGELFNYQEDDADNFAAYINWCALVSTQIDIPDTEAPQVDIIPVNPFNPNPAQMLADFQVLTIENGGLLTVRLLIDRAEYYCSNRGGGAKATTKVSYEVWKNGARALTIHSNGATDKYSSGSRTTIEENVDISATISVNAGDEIVVTLFIKGDEQNRLGSGTMNGGVKIRDMVWRFTKTENI